MGSGDRVLYGMPREDEVLVFSEGGRTIALFAVLLNGFISLTRVVIALKHSCTILSKDT